MWPLANRKPKAAIKTIRAVRKMEAERAAQLTARRQEFARRFAEHLATLPPKRLKLLQVTDLPAENNVELMRDCLQTAKSLQQELKSRPAVQTVRPGLESIRGRWRLCLSVILNDGVDIQSCELHLPEFFDGYRVRTRVNRNPNPKAKPENIDSRF